MDEKETSHSNGKNKREPHGTKPKLETMQTSRESLYEKMKEPKPKTLKEVPHYVKKVVGDTISRLLYIFKLVWEARPYLLFLMIFMAIFNGVTPVVGTYITANLMTKIVERLSDPAVDLWRPLILQFGYTFFCTLVNSLNGMITRISGEVVTNHVNMKIMNKAKEVDLASFDMPDFYERLENASREAGSRPVNLMENTLGLFSKLITMISFIVVLCGLIVRLEWYAAVFALCFIALSVATAVVSFHFRRRNFFYMRVRSKDRRQMNYYKDTITDKDMVKELRLFGLSDLFIGRYKEVFDRYFSGIKQLIYEEHFWNLGLSFLTVAVNCVLFYIIANNIQVIGDYTIYTGALNSVSSAVTNTIITLSTIYEGTLFIDNMIRFMNEKCTIVPAGEIPRIPKRHCGHTIELRNVSFSYPGVDRKVLKNINLKLNAGDTVVLVGLNGAGKTTLIKLLTRLYDPTEGEILLDGHNIKDYDVKELYKLYGIIFQDFGKYAMNVTENIAFGEIEKSLDMENIEYAAHQSSADQFIADLPGGYNTPLMRYFEHDGIELSIGQWQKLSIARAFYSDSDILILDEPTASLDPMAEQEIFNQFDQLRKDKTTVFVSHRLSSATTANKIVVLEHGEIIEVGDHQTLMAKHGTYYTLFSTQAKRYISSEEERIRTENFGDPTHPERPE